MDGLSLVLPAFNEEQGIRQAIVEADEALARLGGDYEVLVVDDGSKDGTFAVASDEASRRPNVRVLRHEQNRGYGAALRTGFTAARFDRVAFTDADCQFHLDDLGILLPLTRDHDIAVGWRIGRKDPWRRRFLSWGYNCLAGLLLGTTVRDIDCALKVFRRDALLRILPESNGFFVNTEMLTRARQLGLSVAEAGVRHRPRERGHSTVSLMEVPRVLASLLPFWWGQSLFAGPPLPRPETRWPGYLGALLVLLVACLLFFARLRAPLLEPQEARYAEIPRQMVAADEWTVPTLHGHDYLDKPPLLYWLVMGSYKLFGPRDWAARLVPGLAGVLTVLAALLWGWRAFGPRAGVCGAAVLCLMPEFLYRGRMLTFDTVLALWVTCALACAWVALSRPQLRWGWWAGSALFCGLGLLTKGPVALALVLVPVVAVSLIDRRLGRVSAFRGAAYVGLACAVAAPWYLAVAAARPEFASYFFWKHNVVRYLAPFDHAKPVWEYVPGLLVGLMPWSLLLPALAWQLARRPWCAARKRPAGLGFALACFAWTFLFFSLAGSKRPTYMLPALPPLALALGWLIARQAPAWRLVWARGARHAELIAAGGLVAGLVCSFAAVWLGFIPTRPGLLLASAALAGLTFLAGMSRRLAWPGAFAVLGAAIYLGIVYLLPAYNDRFSVRGELRRQSHHAALSRPVVCYPQRYDSVSFYLPEREVAVFGPDQKAQLVRHLEANPGSLVLVKGGRILAMWEKELPPNLRFVTRQREGAIVVGRVVAVGPALSAR